MVCVCSENKIDRKWFQTEKWSKSKRIRIKQQQQHLETTKKKMQKKKSTGTTNMSSERMGIKERAEKSDSTKTTATATFLAAGKFQWNGIKRVSGANQKLSRRSRFSFIRFTFPFSCILCRFSISFRRVIACNILIWYMCSLPHDTRGKYVCLLKLHRCVLIEWNGGVGKRSSDTEYLTIFFFFSVFLLSISFFFLPFVHLSTCFVLFTAFFLSFFLYWTCVKYVHKLYLGVFFSPAHSRSLARSHCIHPSFAIQLVRYIDGTAEKKEEEGENKILNGKSAKRQTYKTSKTRRVKKMSQTNEVKEKWTNIVQSVGESER